jgi:hypothetical protein
MNIFAHQVAEQIAVELENSNENLHRNEFREALGVDVKRSRACLEIDFG